MEMNTRL